MNSETQFENLIKTALTDGEEKVVLDDALVERVKDRLKSEKRRLDSNMNINIMGLLRRPAAVICSLIVAAGLTVGFVQPIRVMAQQGVEKISSMIYVAFKGDDGKYKAVQVPYDVTSVISVGKRTKLNDDELSKEVGYRIRIPSILGGGYVLKDRSIVWQPDNMGKKEVRAYFSKKGSKLVLNISDQNFLMSDARENGDNGKEVQIAGQSLYYCEFPFPEYPFIKQGNGGTFDATQKPKTIRTIHALTWEQNGVCYRLWDLDKGDLSLDILKEAVESIVNYQK